jgi:hypothetical protein
MAQYGSEYSGGMVKGAGCDYNNLGNYLGSNNMMAPAVSGQTKGVYIVPTYGAIGYDALTHGSNGNCGSHFTISDAYGAGAGLCNTSYTTRLCGGGGGGGGNPGQGSQGWACTNSQLGGSKCVNVPKGSQRPPGKLYHTSYQCQAGCKPGQQ